MADTSLASSSGESDVSDREAMSINDLARHVAKLTESRRRSRNRTKKRMEKLKEAKERYERDYNHELHYRERDNKSWQLKFAEKDSETKSLKRENAELRAKAKLLRLEVRAKTEQLQRMDHLICDICYDQEKYKVTRCGHGFCADCLSAWFDTSAEDYVLDREGLFVVGEASCPACRKRLDPDYDVWRLYLSEGEAQL